MLLALLLFWLAVDPLSPPEKASFRLWFSYLVESQLYLEPARRPAEIKDCSALARYAFREALAKQDPAWRRRNPLPALPALPLAPHRAGPLFATPAGLRHFADAETLMRHNAKPLGKDLSRARPGDLLFYEQLDDPGNWHVMIFLGRGQIQAAPEPFVAYHTGPTRTSQGELRKLSVAELLSHPQPRWRPVAGNAAFRGVFRWRILED